MVTPNDFYQDAKEGLIILAQNLKKSLEEANGITEQVKPVQNEIETTDQNHTQDDSPEQEN